MMWREQQEAPPQTAAVRTHPQQFYLVSGCGEAGAQHEMGRTA